MMRLTAGLGFLLGLSVGTLLLAGCGSTGSTDGTGGGRSSGGDSNVGTGGSDSDGGVGGSSTGGAADGGSGAGGASGGAQNSGGEASAGGAAAGGAAAGGASGGGSALACPGTPSPPAGAETCRSDDECGPGAYCFRTFSEGGCGACIPPIIECSGDEDCAEGLICEPSTSPVSCSCGGADYTCVAACQPGDCLESEVCGASGHCESRSCDDGFVCPDNYACEPEGTNASVNGCVPKSCRGGEVACAETQRCAPEEEGASLFGCVQKHCATDDYECPVGSHCEAEALGLGCVPDRCQSDSDCAPNHICDPKEVEVGTGCVRRPCDVDTDCDCGACVFNRCEERLFYCNYLAP